MTLSRLTRWTVGAALVMVPVGIVTTVQANASSAREVRRIQAHFDSVSTELAARDLGSLTESQRAHRTAMVAELGRYRTRAAFPHNYDFAGRLVPYFVDRKTGAMCAVANLLAASGRRDIVDRVAQTNNNVWVADLAGDTAFASWLDESGLTLSEAARIQIVYASPVTPVETARQISYGLVAPLAVAGSLLATLPNISGNADGHIAGFRWLGMVSGAAAVASGALLMTRSSASPPAVGTAGKISAGVGLASVFAAGSAMHRHHTTLAAQRDSTNRAVISNASIGAVVTPSGGTGVGVSVKF